MTNYYQDLWTFGKLDKCTRIKPPMANYITLKSYVRLISPRLWGSTSRLGCLGEKWALVEKEIVISVVGKQLARSWPSRVDRLT